MKHTLTQYAYVYAHTSGIAKQILFDNSSLPQLRPIDRCELVFSPTIVVLIIKPLSALLCSLVCFLTFG